MHKYNAHSSQLETMHTEWLLYAVVLVGPQTSNSLKGAVHEGNDDSEHSKWGNYRNVFYKEYDCTNKC